MSFSWASCKYEAILVPSVLAWPVGTKNYSFPKLKDIKY